MFISVAIISGCTSGDQSVEAGSASASTQTIPSVESSPTEESPIATNVAQVYFDRYILLDGYADSWWIDDNTDIERAQFCFYVEQDSRRVSERAFFGPDAVKPAEPIPAGLTQDDLVSLGEQWFLDKCAGITPEDPASGGVYELRFEEALNSTWGESQSASIAVGEPSLAKCRYETIRCKRPDVGDRVVLVPVTIENTGSKVSDWSQTDFFLEFPDGTRTEPSGFSTYQYAPDAGTFGNDVSVRPNSKFKGILVFAAPNGDFTILMNDPATGDTIASWS